MEEKIYTQKELDYAVAEAHHKGRISAMDEIRDEILSNKMKEYCAKREAVRRLSGIDGGSNG